MFSRLSGSWRLPLWNVFIFRSVAKSSACYCTCLTGGTRSLQPRAPLHRSPGKHPSECGAVSPGLVELSEVLRREPGLWLTPRRPLGVVPPALPCRGPAAGSPHTHSCAPRLGVARAPPWDPEALSLHLFPCGPVLKLQLPWIFLGARLCLFPSASPPVPAECLHPGVRPGDPLPSVVWGYHRAHFVTPDSGVGSQAA